MTTRTDSIAALDATLTFAERDAASDEATAKLSDFLRRPDSDLAVAGLLGALAWHVPHLLAHLMDETPPEPTQPPKREAS